MEWGSKSTFHSPMRSHKIPRKWVCAPQAGYAVARLAIMKLPTKERFMPIHTTANIWHNGQLIPWDKAQIHVMSHVVHYGSSVFEGIRCYTQGSSAGVFRLQEHMQRLIDSAKIYRMPLPYTVEQLSTAVVDVIEANGVAPCYI